MTKSLYVVTYDQVGEPKDYQPLYRVLATMGAQRVLESVWVLRSASNIKLIVASLRIHLDANDKLLVCEVSDWSSLNALVDINTIR